MPDCSVRDPIPPGLYRIPWIMDFFVNPLAACGMLKKLVGSEVCKGDSLLLPLPPHPPLLKCKRGVSDRLLQIGLSSVEREPFSQTTKSHFVKCYIVRAWLVLQLCISALSVHRESACGAAPLVILLVYVVFVSTLSLEGLLW